MSMIITLLIYIIQSMEKSKLMVIYSLKILSSGKLFSQTRLVFYCKVLAIVQKMETRTYFYSKKSSTNWIEVHIWKSSMQLPPPQRRPPSRNTNNQCWQAYLPIRLRFSCWKTIGRKKYFQQRHFNPWFPIYLRRHQGLYSLLTYGTFLTYQITLSLD